MKTQAIDTHPKAEEVQIALLRQASIAKRAWLLRSLQFMEFPVRRLMLISLRMFTLNTFEDIILSKLEWFRMGGEVSEGQWYDVLGVLKVQNTALDMDYLRHWATELNLTELFEQALEDAGM
jgi:hypothetical protein